MYVRSSVCSRGSYGVWSSRLAEERSALHCSISRQPQTITKHYLPAVSLPFPPHCSFSFSQFPTELLHSLHTVYVGGMAQWNRKHFLEELLIEDAYGSSEENVEGNGQNTSPNAVMHVRQEQPSRARWKPATEVTGVWPGLRDTDHCLGTPISV